MQLIALGHFAMASCLSEDSTFSTRSTITLDLQLDAMPLFACSSMHRIPDVVLSTNNMFLDACSRIFDFISLQVHRCQCAAPFLCC